MTTDASPLRSPLVQIAGVVGTACALLALVPTDTYAGVFAHPSRMARIGGAIPEATERGAWLFRMALAAAAVLIPLLTWRLVRMCGPAAMARWPLPVDRRGWILLTGITVFGAALRLWLARQSLWYDEISAFLSFAIEGPGVAFGSYAVPTNHVPMTLATWLAWVVSGGSLDETVLRLPAVVAGVAAIPVAYVLGATLFARGAGLVAATIVACAPVAVLESVEARGYAFVILAALVAAVAYARALRSRSAGDYAVFACACAFGAWAHPVAILVPVAAGIVGLLRDRRLVLASLLAGVLAATLLSPLAGDVLASRADYARSAAEQPSLWSREGYEALCQLSLSWSDAWLGLPNPWWAVPFLIGLTTVLAARGPRARHARNAMAPFALALILAAALSLALGTWIYARFLLFTVPIGVVAMTAVAMQRGARMRRLAPLVLPVLAVGTLHGLLGYSVKQPIRDAVEVVAARRAPDDRVATIGLPDNAVGFYAQRLGFAATDTGFLGSDLADVLGRESPRFVVMLYPSRVSDDVLRLLDAQYDRTHHLAGWADWGAGAVEIWERPR